MAQDQFLPFFNNGARLADVTHVLCWTLSSESIDANLQFFLSPGEIPPVNYVTLVTGVPLVFPELKQIRCHRAVYKDIKGHDGFLEAVDVWESRIIRQPRHYPRGRTS